MKTIHLMASVLLGVLLSCTSNEREQVEPQEAELAAADRRPSISELIALFPDYAEDFSYVAETGRLIPEDALDGQMWHRQVWKDLNGDGTTEFSFLAHWYQKGVNRFSKRPWALRQFLFGIVTPTSNGWKVLDFRYSGDMNIVHDAYIRDSPEGLEVLIHESRGQCDDEQPERYALRWDSGGQRLVGPYDNKHLHPFPRNWECGE